VTPHYAVKCNPEPAILKLLLALGSGATLNLVLLIVKSCICMHLVLCHNPCVYEQPCTSFWVGAQPGGQTPERLGLFLSYPATTTKSNAHTGDVNMPHICTPPPPRV
jgi:hypothetical protein